MFRDRDFSRR